MTAEPFTQQSPIKIRLPHPYLTTYHLERHSSSPAAAGAGAGQSYVLTKSQTSKDGDAFPQPLHNDKLRFTTLPATEADSTIDENINTAWARGRRSPVWVVSWEGSEAPTLGQVWLFLYVYWTINDGAESLRLRLVGSGADKVSRALLASMVATELPQSSSETNNAAASRDIEVLAVRSSFWQGCASPLGTQPIWLPTWSTSSVVPHVEYVMTPLGDANFIRHPLRNPKPEPGSLIYSRYIPSLDEHFSLQAIDYTNAEHLELFHNWQNDPRVAKGWMESGSLEQHRSYLRTLHEDPHVIPVFGRFNDSAFAYFELYWAKEDKMGSYYACKDFDRGRHALVGNDEFRGRHRVMAWWPSIMHYEFIDDHRTENVVGEPRLSNEKITMYEYMFGHHQDKWMDLPHKRSNLVVCSRERFFQLCPFQQGPTIAGTSFGFGFGPKPSKL